MTALLKWLGALFIEKALALIVKYLKDEKIDKAKAKEIKVKVKDIMGETNAKIRAKRISDLFNS